MSDLDNTVKTPWDPNSNRLTLGCKRDWNSKMVHNGSQLGSNESIQAHCDLIGFTETYQVQH